LSDASDGLEINVRCQNRSFAARDLYHFKRVVVSEMKAQQAFALIGLSVADANIDDKDVVVVEARIIVQSFESPTSNPDKEIQLLYQTLESAFSICKQV
jgi:hypothetical protein